MENLKKKIAYWYMRYLMVTELYMVEKWERNIFHGIALVLLFVLGLFNHLLVVGGVRFVRQMCYQFAHNNSDDINGNMGPISTEL